MASFFHHYIFQPAVDCFQFPDPHWYLYPVFMAIEFSGVILQSCSTSARSQAIGFFFIGILVFMFAMAFLRLRRRTDQYPQYQAIFFLFAFSLLFAANSAIGRLCLGLEAATTARYMPLLLPAMVGAYLYLVGNRKWIQHRTVVVILFFAAVYTGVFPWQLKNIERCHHMKTSWVQAYRETGSADSADELSGYRIYPNNERIDLDAKLNWLRRHNYSLFRK
jgi:hypothetical protein